MTPNSPVTPPSGPSREQIALGLKIAGAVVLGIAAGFGGAHGFDWTLAVQGASKVLGPLFGY